MITNAEFYDLLAEESINPRGQDREDLRSAMVCVTLARCFGNKQAKLSDYQIKFNSEPKKDTQKEISIKLKTLQNMVKKAGKQ